MADLPKFERWKVEETVMIVLQKLHTCGNGGLYPMKLREFMVENLELPIKGNIWNNDVFMEAFIAVLLENGVFKKGSVYKYLKPLPDKDGLVIPEEVPFLKALSAKSAPPPKKLPENDEVDLNIFVVKGRHLLQKGPMDKKEFWRQVADLAGVELPSTQGLKTGILKMIPAHVEGASYVLGKKKPKVKPRIALLGSLTSKSSVTLAPDVVMTYNDSQTVFTLQGDVNALFEALGIEVMFPQKWIRAVVYRGGSADVSMSFDFADGEAFFAISGEIELEIRLGIIPIPGPFRIIEFFQPLPSK